MRLSPSHPRLCLVTAPNLRVARRLAAKALELRAAACANLVPGLESIYRWKGRIHRDPEILILFKTTARNVPRLERCILENHPYDTPEFLVLTPAAGNRRYLDWIRENCN
ncbi:MAG: divalent-cation tolerance protein CutA [Verrucomicrobiota bacterium]